MIIEVPSGQIAEGAKYMVYAPSGGTIDYNGSSYSHLQVFTGVSGVTDYTVTSGSPIVTDAGYFQTFSIAYEEPYFLGNFTDEGHFLSIAAAGNEKYYPESYTVEEIIQNDNNFIATETLIYLPYLIDDITDVVGNELYNGVTFSRLLELEQEHPEITLTISANNNVEEITINGILFTIDTGELNP